MYLHFSVTVDLTKGESLRFGLVQGKIANLNVGEDQRKCEVDKLRFTGSREPP